jgi:hypothetical protein
MRPDRENESELGSIGGEPVVQLGQSHKPREDTVPRAHLAASKPELTLLTTLEVS